MIKPRSGPAIWCHVCRLCARMSETWSGQTCMVGMSVVSVGCIVTKNYDEGQLLVHDDNSSDIFWPSQKIVFMTIFGWSPKIQSCARAEVVPLRLYFL